MTTEEFILAHREDELSSLVLKIRQYPELDAAFAVQQIGGWQQARLKLPTLSKVVGWRWPVRLSIEQCSSEESARYKRQLLGGYATGADLTGGLGVDSYFLSEGTQEWHYVERDAALCELARHNFALTERRIDVCQKSAETFLAQTEKLDILYVDPSRRDQSGGKVFRLEDCSPDIVSLYERLMCKADVLLVKLSPMLDMQAALRKLPDARQVDVVAVRGEVKELLVVCRRTGGLADVKITAANITPSGIATFTFTEEEERRARCEFFPEEETLSGYLYEPHAAILKAGAFRLLGQRYGLRKLSGNTHLYQSDSLIRDFPGRCFRIIDILDKVGQKQLAGEKVNILTRNYPLRPEAIQRKLKTKDGGDRFVIGARIGEKATLILAERKTF